MCRGNWVTTPCPVGVGSRLGSRSASVSARYGLDTSKNGPQNNQLERITVKPRVSRKLRSTPKMPVIWIPPSVFESEERLFARGEDATPARYRRIHLLIAGAGALWPWRRKGPISDSCVERASYQGRQRLVALGSGRLSASSQEKPPHQSIVHQRIDQITDN